MTNYSCVWCHRGFLPPQLMYEGKTVACLPKTNLPSDWHVTFTPFHWANEQTTVKYI